MATNLTKMVVNDFVKQIDDSIAELQTVREALIAGIQEEAPADPNAQPSPSGTPPATEPSAPGV